MPKFSSRGFTLIELLVVVGLLGVIAAVVLVAIDPRARVGQARDADRIADLKQIHTALEAYYTQQGQYPVMTEPHDGWERSECNPSSCGVNTPAPFLEVLQPTYYEGEMSDPQRGAFPAGTPNYGYMYRPLVAFDNQGYCLVVYMETKNPTASGDGTCDDTFADEDMIYAIDSLSQPF